MQVSPQKLTSMHDQDCLLFLLRHLRQKAGLSQQELAVRLGKHQSFISKYESGERRLEILELRQICLCLGITLAEFVDQLETALANPDAC